MWSSPVRIVALVITALLTCSCGYQLGANKPAEMAGVKSIYIEIPKNYTQYPRLEAKLANHLTDALIQDTTYLVGSKSQADAVLSSSIREVDYTRIRAAVTDGLRPEELQMNVSVNWQVIENSSGKMLKSGKAREDTRFFLTDQRLTTARDNAFPDALGRVSRKVVSQISNFF